VRFGDANAVPVVDGLDLKVDAGEVLAIVGESGSGKSVTMMALMGLIDAPGHHRRRPHLRRHRHAQAQRPAAAQIVGKDIAMVFQDPMTALNPSYTVGFQIEEVLRLHLGCRQGRAPARPRTAGKVEIPGAASRLDAYPHQLSGGMSQRVAIAMAIAGEPKLLIADEPTTALDVTIQAQIMDLLVNLQKERNMALILITHDLAVVAETAQRVCVMYAGQAVEVGQVPELFDIPAHPTAKRCWRRSPSTASAPSAWPPCPASCPAATTARRVACCRRAARTCRTTAAASARPRPTGPQPGALLLPAEPGGGVMAVVLTARDLTRHYEVSRGLFKGHALVRALNGVSFELEAGKTLAVVGESGCGKSTLARALT
jgi:dipeptide transport system ATP-binding protein